jgi:hypothetical protein
LVLMKFRNPVALLVLFPVSLHLQKERRTNLSFLEISG